MTSYLKQSHSSWADALGASSLSIIELSPKALKPLGRKVRIHPQQQIDQLVESFRAFGFAVPVIVDENDRVIAGNARVEAAIQAGFTRIPAVRLATLNAQQKCAFALAENKLSSLARWDKAELKLELGELLSFNSSFSIDVTGFSLEVAQKDAPRLPAAPSIPDGPKVVPVSKAGDVWVLGRHRLICGAGGSPSAIIGKGKRAKLVFAPPEVLLKNVIRLNATSSPIKRESDFDNFKSLVDQDYFLFLTSTLSQLHKNLDAASKARLQLMTAVIIVSDQVGGAEIESSLHELVVGFQPQPRSNRSGAFVRDTSTIMPSWWYAPTGSVNSPSLSNVDAPVLAGLPLMLRRELISKMTNKGEFVLDCSASDVGTLVIAEETERRGLIIQTNLHKADTQVKDWEAATGKQAIHLFTNRTFVQTSADQLELLVEKPGYLPPARVRSRRATQEMMHV